MRTRDTQRDRLLKLLRENCGQWVGLPKILDLRISQYSARFHELRKLGFRIENKVAHHNGQVHSWFRLVLPTAQEKLYADRPEAQRPREHVLEIQRTSL